MSKKPFGQLSVRHENDEQEIADNNQTTSQPMLSQKKKRSVDKNNDEQINEGGFTVVNKKASKSKPLHDDIPYDIIKEDAHRTPHYHVHVPKTIRNNRPFDRHSGTGRGKEISKGGAGGPHTWGNNPKYIAKEATKHEVDPVDEYGEVDTDRCKIIY
jgi:hypothetical protein